jgi:hypothetical protein
VLLKGIYLLAKLRHFGTAKLAFLVKRVYFPFDYTVDVIVMYDGVGLLVMAELLANEFLHVDRQSFLDLSQRFFVGDDVKRKNRCRVTDRHSLFKLIHANSIPFESCHRLLMMFFFLLLLHIKLEPVKTFNLP